MKERNLFIFRLSYLKLESRKGLVLCNNAHGRPRVIVNTKSLPRVETLLACVAFRSSIKHKQAVLVFFISAYLRRSRGKNRKFVCSEAKLRHSNTFVFSDCLIYPRLFVLRSTVLPSGRADLNSSIVIPDRDVLIKEKLSFPGYTIYTYVSKFLSTSILGMRLPSSFASRILIFYL